MVSSEGLNKNTASLLTLEGAGFVKHPDGTQSPLWQGIKLGIGDIVVTSPGSKAVIVLADGSEFEFGKAQGDAVKIDTSVLDVVADVHEVMVLDLSYLYPLLNENQLDHPSTLADENAATLVVADGIDTAEIRDLLDGNPAPAYGGDLGGGDLTSGNRYVVLESNPIADDTNPFPTNPIPEFSSDASQQFVAPESAPLALLMQSFSAAFVIPEVPEVPVPAVPLHISLALDRAFADPALVDDDEPVTYHVSLSHEADSDITINPVLILNGVATPLDAIIILKGQLSCDINVKLPEEVDDTTAYYKLLLTVDTNLVGGIDVVPDESSPGDNNQTVVAVNTDLSVLSDFLSEHYESAISVDWIGQPLGNSLDDETNYTGSLTVTVTDATLSQHITSDPILLDVYAEDLNGLNPTVLLATLTTSNDPLAGQIPSNGGSGHSIWFDNVPFFIAEGLEGTAYRIFVVPHGEVDPYVTPPVHFFSSESVTSWNSLTLPVIADALQEELSFTIDTDAVAAGALIEDPHGQESQFTIHFSGELQSAITVEVTIDGLGTGNFVTFDPANVDPNTSPVGFAIYDQFTGYSFDFAIPDTEDGRTHAISLNLSTIDVVAAGFEEVSANLPSVTYAIYPDVEVTLGTFTVDDELGATATVSIDNLLAQDLVLQVHAVATDGSSYWDGTVTILALDPSAELNVPLDETTEGKTFNVSLSYVYIGDGDIPVNQVYFANPSDLLSADPVNVDVSEVTNVAFTVPVDTVHISLTPDVNLINDEDPLASITFTYHIDQLILDGQFASFDAKVGSTSILNVLTIDSQSLTQDVDGTWFGTFSIAATSLPDGAQGLTLVPSDLGAATAAFGGMDDFVVDTVNLNVVDYTIVSNTDLGINTFVFSELDVSDQGSSSGEPLHGADLIEGFDLIEGSALQFEHAFVGKASDFNLDIVSQDSNINGLSVNDEGLVTFLNHDVVVEINQSNLAQAVDFLVQHSTGGPGLTVDFLVNNGVGVDTYVFNQGEAHAGQPAYTLVNVSNQEAAGLSLGYTSSELIHIEHG